ncbi:MAG: hypothetical protein SFW08_13950 [Gemmatimonadaceae bacterium]|nr:hypothetical protein [Gemmatimonadaceae bacterium]
MQVQMPQHIAHTATDRPAPDALIDLAHVYMLSGLLTGSTRLIDLAIQTGGSPSVAADCHRAINDAKACDAAIGSAAIAHGEFAVPSIERNADGSPKFIVPIPAEAAGQAEVQAAVVAELTGGGIDAELRSFLSAMLEPGDAFIDCDPGFGFAALTAATRHPGATSMVARSADDGHATFLRRAFVVNRVARGLVEAPIGQTPQSLDALMTTASAFQPSRVIIHAGQAEDVAAMWPEVERHLRNPRVAAIVWSPDAQQSMELQQHFERIGVTQFVIAHDANGAILVPAGQLRGASIVIGIPAHVLAGRQAA